MDFNVPLIGTREQNYKFFYCMGSSVVVSLVLLLLITGYTAYVSSHLGGLMSDGSEVLGDVQRIVPEIDSLFGLIKKLCNNGNFTKHYGPVCL